MTQQKQNGNLVAIITMFFIFAMISYDELPGISVYGNSCR